MKVKLLKPRDIFETGAVLTVDKPVGDLLVESGAAELVKAAVKTKPPKPRTVPGKDKKVS